MKSNIYSIFIFLIGLFATYIVTQHFDQIEQISQKKEITKQSKSIANTVQLQVIQHASQISLIAQRWQSIDTINNNWANDTVAIQTLLPSLSDFKLYLIEKQPALLIPQQKRLFFESNTSLLQQQKQLASLDKGLSATKKSATFQSSPKILDNKQVIIYQYAPVFVGQALIGYLQATLNISQLLDHQVAQFQIDSPFSLSETGLTIYSALPKEFHITDVREQLMIPILGHQWKLMVWPKHSRYFYRYTFVIGLLLSVLLAMVAYFLQKDLYMRGALKKKKYQLVEMEKEFKASKSKLVQSNKLSSLGEIATGIAHEINQPLQVISIHAEICNESLQKKDYQIVDQSFVAIISQVERIEKIVKQVGSFGRNSELDHYNKQAPIDIFDSVINIVINQYHQEQVELRQVLPASLPPIHCNKIQIEQVLVNLLINAKDAVEHTPEKIVFIKAHDKKGKLYIEVSDSGCGIEASKLNDIFAPFYTTKALGKGTGLGLSISYSIIHQHKGELQVISEVGKGSTFTIILPLS